MNQPVPMRRLRQSGVSLIVVLVLLLVMTLLGLAVLGSTLLEERMSANMYDRSLGFQAAESALREGEALAATNPLVPVAGCAAGLCAIPVAADPDRWTSAAFTGWQSASSDLGPLPAPASFIVEYMGEAPTWPGCDRQIPMSDLCMSPRYRITARSTAPDRADVLLQTNFILQ
ncbi:pilus assembly PilX family protein [Luteimonas changyuni]|uniref:pilus assembly PilX family protein n=1 Tax=Luteimonas sp. MJ145 TaxID=3129234 RepID=UPI0031BB722B